MNRPYDVIGNTGNGTPIKAWTKGVPVEQTAIDQLVNLSRLPFIHKHVAVMPDVHAGKGSTVGSVIATKGAIIPAAVGVDIGCGMCANLTTLTASDLPDNLAVLRNSIELFVPHGRTDNGGVNDRGAWGDVGYDIQDMFRGIFDNRADNVQHTSDRLQRAMNRAVHHCGTLGTGNHFIEVCLDEQNRVWVMLHSGSRGIGNAIGQHYIELAKKDMRAWFIDLPEQDLAYLPEGTKHFDEYVEAVSWAQDFARLNREIMMRATMQALHTEISKPFTEAEMAVNCHHNYVERENHFGANVLVTRKGAVRAREGDLGIIPGSMGTRSYIVAGKGNRESFCSCSHGAGRRMSRTEARRTFTLEDHATATAGVECRKDIEVIDETPGAYKDIDAVMAAQTDLVSVLHTLHAVLCVKG